MRLRRAVGISRKFATAARKPPRPQMGVDADRPTPSSLVSAAKAPNGPSPGTRGETGSGTAEPSAPGWGEGRRPPLIEARNTSKYFGHVRALENVDFALYRGEIHALVGDNGAGKSTLVKIIAGAIPPSTGQLYLEGAPVGFDGPLKALEAGISTVYQNLALVGVRTIADNLFLGREPTRYGVLQKRRMHTEAREMLAALRQLNITDTHAKLDDLSGGQRQAVAIARGVRMGSRVLILDEPTAALGVRESQGVLELVRTLKGEHRSILIVSHNLAHVFEVADRITVLRSARKVGTVETATTSPDDVVKMITGTAFAL